MREFYTLNPEKLNIWAGIIGDYTIRLLFAVGNLNADFIYLALLQNVMTTLSNLDLAQRNLQVPTNGIWFQQDERPIR